MSSRMGVTKALAWSALLAGWLAAAPAQGQEDLLKGLEQRFQQQASQTGVFFRADAPRWLRNAADPNLPVYLEIINGVEKIGHTTVSGQFVRRDPLRLEGVNIFIRPAAASFKFADEPLLLGASKRFSFDARSGTRPFVVVDRFKKTLTVPREEIQSYLAEHYPGAQQDAIALRVSFRVTGVETPDFYLRVQSKAEPLPQLPGWYRGDLHYHSAFTDNPAERGGPLGVSREVALESGLSWVLLADHSTDLTAERYREESNEAAKYSDDRFMFIRGEEVTVSSGHGSLMASTLHLVALPSPDDPARGFPAGAGSAAGTGEVISTGEGSLASPATPLTEVLERIAGAGGFAYAAHPFDPISPLLRGTAWDLDSDFLAPGGKQLQPGLVGLEGWNRSTTATADNARDPYCLAADARTVDCFAPDPDADQYARLERAIELGWKPLLAKSLPDSDAAAPNFKVFFGAGTDAHGDFNYEATFDVVDFLSKPWRVLSGYAETNAFGSLATVVECPQGMGPRGENVLRALRDGRSVSSNGPLLVARLRLDSAPARDSGEIPLGGLFSGPRAKLPPLELEWVSDGELGPFTSIRLIVGTHQGESAEEINIPASMRVASGNPFKLNLGKYLASVANGWAYIRLEARTRAASGVEFRCYTNPIWVRLS